MGKMSAAERAELERRLREDDEADTDDSDYEVGFPDGGYIRGKWDKVRSAAAARGFKLEPDPPADGEQEVPKEGADEEPRRFGGRRVS
jgi:hypothetical protein